MKNNKKPETIAEHFSAFARAVEKLLRGRCCDCELPGVEVMLERTRADFAAASPHLAQMERGATRAELCELQQVLIDRAQRSVLAIAVAVANVIGMWLGQPDRIDDGRAIAFEILRRFEPFVVEDDVRAQDAFMASSWSCHDEMAGVHAS